MRGCHLHENPFHPSEFGTSVVGRTKPAKAAGIKEKERVWESLGEGNGLEDWGLSTPADK